MATVCVLSQCCVVGVLITTTDVIPGRFDTNKGLEEDGDRLYFIPSNSSSAALAFFLAHCHRRGGLVLAFSIFSVISLRLFYSKTTRRHG